MNTYEIYQVKKAISAHNGSRDAYKRRPVTRGSNGGQWDYVLRAVCLGCGRTLGQFELQNNLGFCFNCRKILFPETVARVKSSGSRWRSPYPRGHSL